MISQNTFGPERYKIEWGVQSHALFLNAENFCCPYCKNFSYFCHGNFKYPSALMWKQSVVGFTLTSKLESIGEAVLCCPSCGKHFNLLLSEKVFMSYVLDCPLWPKPKVELEPELELAGVPEVDLQLS